MTRLTVGADPAVTGAIERGFLVRYRVFAFSTATLLIVLVFAGVPLQLAAGRPEVVNAVGTVHGFLYVGYLVVAFQLTRRLGVPKWQMVLVLLAGTVPFCAFVAERNLSRRFMARGRAASTPEADGAFATRVAHARRTWFSPRALLLHLEVAVIASGCVAAGWWQATRALAGNGLSWVYSVEWPVFALLAVAGWWFLIHEDPEAYRARKQRSPGDREVGAEGSSEVSLADPPRKLAFDRSTARAASALAVLVGVQFALGIVTLLLVPPGRPSGVLPTRWSAIYLVHAVVGLPLLCGAIALLARVRRSPRIARLSGWLGLIGVAIAGAGGLLTIDHTLRLGGLAVMFIGPLMAFFGYLFPALERSAG